jgi:hypothetical protein
VQPIKQDGKYLLAVGNTLFECDPHIGGRITAFALEGVNVLAGPEINADNYGSTFWTSPQSDWDWPPPSEIDRQEYSSQIADSALVLTSPMCPPLGVRIIKRFSIDQVKRAVVLEYAIENVSSRPRAFAPWEVSRVAAGGLTFFPMAQRQAGSGQFQPLVTREIKGVTWHGHDVSAIEADQKLFADGADGWIAHVAGDLLFIKAFVDIAAWQGAPGEGEIEIYANRSYVEVEQQGAYSEIQPGGRSWWTVQWYLRKIPQAVDPALGSESLVCFVQETIGGSVGPPRS